MSDLEQRIDEHVSREEDVEPEPCPYCDGEGWLEDIEIGMGHGCGGDERICSYTCPIPEPYQVQVGCGACEGTGWQIEKVKEE